MEIMRTMMDFEFDTKKVQNTHFHQDLEILYVLDGGLDPFISAYLRWLSLGCPDRKASAED